MGSGISPSPARFAGGLSHFVGEAVWPLRGRGGMADAGRLRGARLWAGMAWGARRMQKVLDGDPTHAISLEGSLADHSQPGRGEGAREPRELDG